MSSTAVMQRRVEPADSLDFFPTPPWATRALVEHVLGDVSAESCWEPAAGEGHMAEVLAEYFAQVIASDVHDYGKGYEVGSFTGIGLDVVPSRSVGWVISNPPFNLAHEFLTRALAESENGVALLLRTSWVEGSDRWKSIFSVHPPAVVAVFVERVPMVKGEWDPEAGSATSYSWFVWRKGDQSQTRLTWIPPGCRKSLEKPSDRQRFAKQKPAPLFAGVFQ